MPDKPSQKFINDFSNLNREGVLGAALGPNYYGRDSISERAKKRLRRILSEGGYKFGDMDERTGGLDYNAIMRGEEP